MDVVRIFTDLREWSRGLTPEQETLVARLMDAKDSKGFAGLEADGVRALQEQMLRSDEDAGRVDEVKRAAEHLQPAVSDIGFI